jgi:Cytochrome c554 and c-prime
MMDIRKILLLMVIVSIVFFFARCFQEQHAIDPRGEAYAGSEKCINCHQSISSSYAHTAHFLSTRVASETSVMGKFSKDSNELFVNDSIRIMMEKRDSGLYQVLYINNKQITARRFDLVMGAVKGQTYLSWHDIGLFQLPVSYISVLNRWTASPGFALADLKFNRSITKDCFECHSSFANRDEHGLLDFRENQNSWVFNIDCERCHGPAAAHIQFHEANPNEKQARFMVSFKSLNRQQKIDLCAVCHSGNNNILLKSRFAFKMGDSLTSYMLPINNGNQLDVHGNQTQLLSQSKCFRMSNLECSTCHNTHINERGFVKVYNEHCQNCHSPGKHFCGMATDSNTAFIKNNCTRCHMPAQASGVIRVQAASNTTKAIPTMVVNHRIAVYPEETANILKTMVYGKMVK